MSSRWNLNVKSLLWLISLLVILLIMPSVVPRYQIYLLALIIVNGMVAMSLNIVLGHGGIFQFHHGVFYGVGAYTVAILLTRTALPVWVAFIAGPVFAAFTGVILGLICIQLSGLYFGMLQLSLGSVVWVIVYRWYDMTGGDNGIYGITMPSILSSLNNTYYFILIICVIYLLAMYLILKSPFGRTLAAIRDNPQRCEAVGVNIRRHQILAQVIATFFAGTSGVLIVVLERSVFPELLFWKFSLEILIMCLLGGWFTFTGPMVGAALIIILRTFVGIYTEYWTLVMGVMLALVIFFLPQGVIGYVEEMWSRFSSLKGKETQS